MCEGGCLKAPKSEEFEGVGGVCVSVSWGYLAGVRVLFKRERVSSIVSQLND